MTILGVTVVDANGEDVPNAQVVIRDMGSQAADGLREILQPGSFASPTRHIFDLGTLPKFRIDVTAPEFFATSFVLEQPPTGDLLKVNARSPVFGFFASETDPQLHHNLQIAVTRMRRAPRQKGVAPRGQALGVVDDIGGIWIKPDGDFVGLSKERANRFPVLLERSLLKDAAQDNWDRFNWTAVNVDPDQPLGGSWFEWVEYGDPSGFKILVALWVLNGAGARADGAVDILSFFSPRTDIPAYAPDDVYPYKRKRNQSGIVQPYSFLAYRYLGLRSGPFYNLALAYQAMATKRALVIAMPICAYGYWGPLLSCEGLFRMTKEIAIFVGDNTKNIRPPEAQSLPFASRPQSINRIGIAGYSAGALDALRLFDTRTIPDLISKLEKGDQTDKAAAKRIAALRARLWSASADEFERKWKEYYNIDGFFGSNKIFPQQFAAWFEAASDRILRVYATPGRMENPVSVVASQLSRILRGSETEDATRSADNSFRALAWHRKDNRASLGWFSSNYILFESAPFMPVTPADDDLPDHHTIPRIVFAHAISQSNFAR